MNPKIIEDVRPLAQFYTEPAARHRVHSRFVHHFLPRYVQQNPYAFFFYLFNPTLEKRQEPNRFIQSRWNFVYEDQEGLVAPEKPGEPMVFRRVSDLGMSILSLAGKPMALIQMPAPEQAPEAFLAGVVLLADANQPQLWPRDAAARVFTLELTTGAPRGGLVCEWTKEGKHQNYGISVIAKNDPMELSGNFLKTIHALLNAPQTVAPGSLQRNVATGTSITINQPTGTASQESKRPWWKMW